ncbi:hypothetical protein [Streptomyces zingiberis]|uniref:Heparin-binding hemagglutinin n=1 Tax=Streptomyces zingiberis TaxID=2053010 RepID=A0ABX1BW22_9ACTN|nr:hypothetical protein [Streptomyces zingiberis]NJQ00085.1 hypothetical protein [Streptomyces zingiberis]
MATTDELRKTLKDPTPLYAAVGTADLAAEKLRELPALVERLRAEAPERFAGVRKTDPKAVQERFARQAKEAQSTVQTKVTEVLGTLDTDIKKFRESAQTLALQGVGRAAEYAVKARETYDVLAERGRGTVQTWRGDAAEQVTDIAIAVEPEPAAAPAGAAAKSGPAASTATATKAEAAPAAKPAARKSTGRKAPAGKSAPKSAE